MILSFGMGMPGDYLEPVLPGIAPRGTAPVAAAGAAAATVERGLAARIEAIELEPPPAERQPDEAERIAEEVGRGDLAAAAQRFARLTAPPTTVAAAVLYQVARICLQRLNRPADARAALDQLLARFPKSQAAQ